jgi:hypothetical protein
MMALADDLDPAGERDAQACRHRERALAALGDPADRRGFVAVAEALLALEARLDEVACYLARLG